MRSHHLSWWWLVLLLLLFTRGRISLCEAQATCELSTTPTVHTISTTQAATKLGQDILLCPGGSFAAEWQGSVSIAQPLELANGTSLVITGSSTATVDGQGEVPLFVVNGSTLLVDGVMLSAGYGTTGGVVSAREGATVTFLDCIVNGNKASSKGGMARRGIMNCWLLRRLLHGLLGLFRMRYCYNNSLLHNVFQYVRYEKSEHIYTGLLLYAYTQTESTRGLAYWFNTSEQKADTSEQKAEAELIGPTLWFNLLVFLTTCGVQYADICRCACDVNLSLYTVLLAKKCF